jgi:hypothetical protein
MKFLGNIFNFIENERISCLKALDFVNPAFFFREKTLSKTSLKTKDPKVDKSQRIPFNKIKRFSLFF